MIMEISALLPVGVGDLAQAGEGPAELGGTGAAEVPSPLGFDRGLGLPGDLDRGPAPLGDLDQPGPGVARIRDRRT
jgi:hypothetical protein